ncbi:uncharacterized protein [Panulirus ornatus]|uniref:uncharacterized protein n=1 Tax=Panulirus ornatus TaxID=150431 RepID=UPI003A858BF8
MAMSHDVVEGGPGKSVMDDDADEKDDVKRKSRNLSEKKRRDQFNLLINELSSMVASSNRKMDKSTVLKATIAFLKNQKEISVRSQTHEIREDWKPSFLSNEEFTHLMLEALDGFIMTVSCSGRVLYTSESITPLLGHLPCDLSGIPLYDLMLEEERGDMKRFLSNPALLPNPNTWLEETKEKYPVAIHLRRGTTHASDSTHYEKVHLIGYFERYNCPSEDGVLDFSCSEAEDSVSLSSCSRGGGGGLFQSSLVHSQQTQETTKLVFVAIARMERPQLEREMMIIEPSKTEFTSRHSLEWKFLFLDHRAPTIIGYMPFEVLGTSGYDYYHVEDLEKVAVCHEQLMKTGKGTSCYYRFLTKGQQWIWLQTQYYITYHQWNSKPEFIVCTNTVVSYSDVKAERAKELVSDHCQSEVEIHQPEDSLGLGSAGLCSAGPSGLRMSAPVSGLGETPQQLPDEKPIIQPDRTTLAGPSHLQPHLQQHPQLVQQQTQPQTEHQNQQSQQHSVQQQQQQQQQLQLQQQQQQMQQQQQQQQLQEQQQQLQEQQQQQQEEQQNQQQQQQQQKQQQSQQNLHLQHCISVQSQSSQLQPSLPGPPPPSISPQPSNPQQIHNNNKQQQQQQQAQQMVGIQESTAVGLRDSGSVAQQQSLAPMSPSSQHSTYLSPQTPQHLASRGEPPPWPSKARSDDGTMKTSSLNQLKVPAKNWGHFRSSLRKESSQYSGGSSLSESGSSRKRARLQHAVQQQQQDQQRSQLLMDDLAPPRSPCSDASVNSHVSRGSMPQENTPHFGSKSGNKERYYRKIELPPELSRSMSSSRLSSSYEEEKKEDQFLRMMVTSPSGSASSHNSVGGFGGVDQQYLGSNGGTQNVAGAATAAVSGTPAQVVQVAAVPISPVIPINPVVTNFSVQLPAASTTEGLRQSLILSPDQRQLQEQLRRKHAELQQQILRQQEELRQVNDQLIMAQYGSLGLQHVYKGGLQYNATTSVGNTSGFQGSVTVGSGVGGLIGMGTGSIPVSAAVHQGAGTVALGSGTLAGANNSSIVQPVALTSPASIQSPTITVSTLNPAQVSVQGMNTQGMAVPYQLSHQQAQMLFAQPGGTSQAHHQSQQHQPKK